MAEPFTDKELEKWIVRLQTALEGAEARDKLRGAALTRVLIIGNRLAERLEKAPRPTGEPMHCDVVHARGKLFQHWAAVSECAQSAIDATPDDALKREKERR